MEYKQIQELIKMINKSNVSELSIEDGDFKITIKQQAIESQPQFISIPQMQMPMQHQGPQQMQQAQPATQLAPAQDFTTVAPAAAQGPANSDKLVTIKSPMIGTFYRSPSPDKPVFVNIGDEIKPGDVLCIIEAMKLFNEIECEIKGKVIKVLVDESSPVEYDQPLFLVDPS